MASTYLKAAEELRDNPGQWAAYQSLANCVVLAGPGSGKTKTLTIKLARMLAEDVRSPRGIACITFNNECVRELQRRLQALGVDPYEPRLFVGTIHSFSLKNIITPFAEIAGLDLPYPITVATQSEQNKAFESAVTDVLGRSARASDFKVAIEAYRKTRLDRDSPAWREYPDFAAVIERYEALVHGAGLIDFDDMMLQGRRLVEGHKWVRKALTAKFPILAIDEYQDLGLPLHSIVMELCFRGGMRLFAVGDADQSIYSFTGADPELLRNLSKMKGVELVRLPFNYRSAPEILSASEVALGEKRGYTARSNRKGLIGIHHFKGGLEEQATAIIGDLIPAALSRDNSRSQGDIAIIYTNYNDGNLVSKIAADAGCEFVRIDNGAPIPMSPLIRWLQDCAQWCSGGWQQSKPPLAKLIQAWRSFNYSLKRPVELRDAQRKLVSCLFGHRDPEMSFRRWLGDLRSDVLDPVFASEGSLREESLNVSKLYELTEVGGEMEMSTVATFSGKGGSRKHLNLITFHSAKSLEFDVVFLLGVDEGRIPSWADNTPEKLAEARRRFYVGITRAKREVHLTYSGFNVNQWGRRFDSGPSRFLIELQNRMKG